MTKTMKSETKKFRKVVKWEDREDGLDVALMIFGAVFFLTAYCRFFYDMITEVAGFGWWFSIPSGISLILVIFYTIKREVYYEEVKP